MLKKILLNKWVLLLSLVISSYIYAGVYERNNYTPIDDLQEIITDISEDEQFLEKAENLESYAASQHKVALVFAGLTTPVEMQKIVDLLQEYHMKAVFACDGVSASEIPDTVNEIRTAGNIIANYGLNKEKHWDQLDDETILDLLPNVTTDMKEAIMARKDVQDAQRLQSDDELEAKIRDMVEDILKGQQTGAVEQDNNGGYRYVE